MKCLILVTLAAMTMAALLPEHHMVAQDMCGSLPDLSFLKSDKATPELKARLLPHLQKVCEIYRTRFGSVPDLVAKRNLLSGLTDMLGQDSKLGSLLKAADALNKAKGVFDEVKKLAPDVHDHLQGSIKDVHDGLQDLIDSIANEFTNKNGATTAKY